MKTKLAKRALFLVITVAVISLILWGLADARSEATTTVLAFIGIIITTCIWFSMAWRIYEVKPAEAWPAIVICLAPYLLTAGLDIYMAPYYYDGGGNAWASILDSYGNILFNSNYLLLAGWPEQPTISTSLAILMLQILLPAALAYLLRFVNKFQSKQLD